MEKNSYYMEESPMSQDRRRISGSTNQLTTAGKGIGLFSFQLKLKNLIFSDYFRVGNFLERRFDHVTLPVFGVECP